MDLVKGGSLTYSNRHKLRMTQTNPSVIPNDLIIRIIQEATTKSTLEYHIQRMEWIPQHRNTNNSTWMRDHLGFREVIKQINDSMGDYLENGELKLYGDPENHEWMIFHPGDRIPEGWLYHWIWDYTEDAANLGGCPPTLELVLEGVYQEKIDKLYPKVVPYLKRWATEVHENTGETGYWGDPW